MVARGWSVACASLLLAMALLAIPLAPSASADGACQGALFQDDAGSGQDAGDALATGIHLSAEGDYVGTIGQLHATGLDTQDWYRVQVPAGERTVMATLSMDYGQPAPDTTYVTLEAWEPGELTPTHTAQENGQGELALTFQTEDPGTWYLRIAWTPWPSTGDCLATPTQGPATAAEPNYGLYFGCDPHCIQGPSMLDAATFGA